MDGPAAITVNPRDAAAFGAAVVCGLLLLQYAPRRRPVILRWAAGWLLIAPAMLLVARGYVHPAAARAAAGASQFLGICTATLFVWSGDLYRQTQYVELRRLRLIVPVGIYFLAAPLLFTTSSILTPGYLLSAGLLVGAGSMYAAVLLERRMIGAGLVAFVLFGLGISNLAAALVFPSMVATGRLGAQIVLLNVVLYAL